MCRIYDVRSTSLNRSFGLALVCFLATLSACIQPMTMYSLSGERLEGKWRYARDNSGLIQVMGPAGETLVGSFKPVSRRMFFDRYEKIFGSGTVMADGPDVSAFGNAFAGMLGGSKTLVDAAYGENFNPAADKSSRIVAGPLFYWSANLQGDKRTTMHCLMVGSAYTGHGLGKCKETSGTEYTVEF